MKWKLFTQSCPTLQPRGLCIVPGSSVHGILQARVLGWVAISFSRATSQPRDWTHVSCIVGRFFTVWATRQAHQKAKVAVKFLQQCISLLHESYKWLNALRVCSVAQCVQLFAIPWTLAPQAPLSMEFFRQEYWSGLSFPPLEALPDSGIGPASLMSPGVAGGSLTLAPPNIMSVCF